jgi:hypothetical protein
MFQKNWRFVNSIVASQNARMANGQAASGG